MPPSNVIGYLWRKKDGPFGKELQVSEAPTPESTSGYSSCFKQREVARWTNVGGPITIGGSPIYSSSEVPISRISTEGVVKRIRRISNSPTDPDAEGSDELDSEEVEVVLHSAGHQSSTSPPTSCQKIPKPALVSTVRPSPMVTSQQLQPMASSSRREDNSPFPFSAAQVIQQWEFWPIRVAREDPNMEMEGQDV
ncbi:hypothetical protein O181_046754 [Austropuccinia psidii MF-1]|uniref:Uncharacterized protein n=1 Tax=Austropuccinia psidii MF-1 TaxID=1389203 RepID=A0A9Q3HLI0_9BASI|nr:hypothetical protein [Austropuccinia psidii MF-1]